MAKLTEILPDIFVIEVPADAYDFEIRGEPHYHAGLWYLQKKIGLPLPTEDYIAFSKIGLKYLGYCTKDEISFDVSVLVEKEGAINYFFNYCCEYDKNNLFGYTLTTAEQSFRSLLLKHGLFWESETINIPKRDYKMFPGGKKAAQRFNEEYQQNEQSKLTGKLVVLKKVK